MVIRYILGNLKPLRERRFPKGHWTGCGLRHWSRDGSFGEPLHVDRMQLETKISPHERLQWAFSEDGRITPDGVKIIEFLCWVRSYGSRSASLSHVIFCTGKLISKILNQHNFTVCCKLTNRMYCIFYVGITAGVGGTAILLITLALYKVFFVSDSRRSPQSSSSPSSASSNSAEKIPSSGITTQKVKKFE